MPDITVPAANNTGRLDLDLPVSGPDDTLRASVHPDGRAVTLSYWGGADRLVLDLGHLDALVQLLGRVKAAAEPAQVTGSNPSPPLQ